ncbi:MAG TPA: tRNA glutamyl-Q(34) synthetase GluQRS, partial [bacterium]|nr:tRNA glutamyl-Q(34) synthetase GluQRS [bacterium]
MHLGNARTALLAWLQARAAGGSLVMRVEDLDAQRVVPGAEAKILEELRWLGLDWDEGPDVGGAAAPYRQSERAARYADAVRRLLAEGKAFECACSRAEIARASSAPHAGEEGARYPGTCRDLAPGEAAARARALGRAPAVRFRGGAHIAVRDLVRGDVDPLPAGVDDFVIQRVDGIAAYQLAVVVDDAAMGVTHVLRADDLLDSTPRQLALYQALSLAAPAFAHVPLVLAPGGERLAKRNRPASIGELRAAEIAAAEIVGALAASAGLVEEGTRVAPRDLIDGFSLDKIVRAPVEIDTAAFARPKSGGAALVRAVRGADAIALAEVYVASWRAAYRGIVPAAVLDALSVRTQTARWQKMLAGMAKSETRAWLVEDEGRARGFVV